LLIIGGCIVFRHPAATKPARAPSVPVSAATVKSGSIDVYLDELGTVTPVSTVTVTSRVTGAVTEIHYTEGQMVKKNDLLAVIDPRPYEAAVTQAEGQLEKDNAISQNAQIDLSRYQDAYRQHAIPEQQVATQQATLEGDEGTVKVDEGNLEAAQVNLEYTHIVSPIDGRVGLRLVDLGNIVSANGTTPLVTITELQPITVIFTLAEDDLSRVVKAIRGGRTLRVAAFDRGLETKLADGKLLTIDNQVNTSTGTIRARAVFANAHNELFPNQFVNARLYLARLKQVNLIPTEAIQRNNDAAQVYIVQANGTVQLQTIKITATDGDTSAVTGVNSGQTVVTDGFDRLQNGTRAAIRKPSPGAPRPPSTSE
jgi:multidrug efflux system membrane fusion protein